jgi:hypothetical protein
MAILYKLESLFLLLSSCEISIGFMRAERYLLENGSFFNANFQKKKIYFESRTKMISILSISFFSKL